MGKTGDKDEDQATKDALKRRIEITHFPETPFMQ